LVRADTTGNVLTTAWQCLKGFVAGRHRTDATSSSFRRPLTHIKASWPGVGHKKGMNEIPLIDPGKAKILSLPDETQFAANGIVSRTLLRTLTTRVVLFGFADGQELSEHTSTAQALIQILSGSCEFSLEGKPHRLKAGDLLHLPPNLPHAVKATETFSMLLTLFKPVESAPALSRVKAGTLAVN
jgi:quercetin dioxygenase-like cupin family protein